MTKVGCGSTALGDLPVDLLAVVLQHAAQKDRLTSCTLVSVRWRHAARLATRRVQCSFADNLTLATLSAWLHGNPHANNIDSVQVQVPTQSSFWKAPALRLPFWKLSDLHCLQLPFCHLKPAPASSFAKSSTSSALAAAITTGALAPGSDWWYLAALTALSRLELDHTILDITAISSCSGLQHLHLHDVLHVPAECPPATLKGFDEQEEGEIWGEQAIIIKGPRGRTYVEEGTWTSETRQEGIWPPQLTGVVSQLTKLTHLTVQYDSCFERSEHLISAVAALSRLQHLQHLDLGIIGLKGNDLVRLPTSLVQLQLVAVSALTLSTVSRLSQLQHLQLTTAIEFNPLLLCGMPQLTGLCLVNCDFHTLEEARQLFSALDHLTQLQNLSVESSLKLQPLPWRSDPPDTMMYSALTSSSQLTCLNLSKCKWSSWVSEKIFQTARPCKALKTLIADADLFTAFGSFSGLVTCCPALQQLEITSQPETPRCLVDIRGLSALAELTALTALTFSRTVLFNEALGSIAACPALQQLTLVLQAHERHCQGL